MRIAVFGGTFNPIHYGHLRTAEEIQEMFAFDRLIFIPAGNPPFKKSDIAAHHRYKMTKLSVKGSKFIEVSDIEFSTVKPSYSVDTISRLKDKCKDGEFFFIIGIDAFGDLPKWNQPVRLTELTNFVIISRPGFCFEEIVFSPYLSNVNKEDLRAFDRGKKTRLSLKLTSGRKAFLCKVSGFDISASHIRELIKKGKSIKYLLPESVESYIISHRLYKQ